MGDKIFKKENENHDVTWPLYADDLVLSLQKFIPCIWSI